MKFHLFCDHTLMCIQQIGIYIVGRQLDVLV